MNHPGNAVSSAFWSRNQFNWPCFEAKKEESHHCWVGRHKTLLLSEECSYTNRKTLGKEQPGPKDNCHTQPWFWGWRHGLSIGGTRESQHFGSIQTCTGLQGTKTKERLHCHKNVHFPCTVRNLGPGPASWVFSNAGFLSFFSAILGILTFLLPCTASWC